MRWPPQPRASGVRRPAGGCGADGRAGPLLPPPGAASRHLRGGASVAPGRRVRQLAAGQLDHERGARETVVLPAGRRAAQSLSSTAFDAEGARCARTASASGRARGTAASTCPQGWWYQIVTRGLSRRREAPHGAALGLRERVGARVIAARRGHAPAPAVGEVPVQVNAAGVLARVRVHAVGVDRRHDP